MTTTTGSGAQSAAANGYSAFYNTGTLIIYSGVVPLNAKASLSGNLVLATHTLAGFTELNGVLTANAIASVTIDANAGAGTLATFGRILVSATSEYQAEVGAEITITPDANYVAGGTSNVTNLILAVPDA
jgi:hypothetical protein